MATDTSTSKVMDVDLSKLAGLAESVLTAQQRALLGNLPEPHYQRVRRRLQASLLLSARLHLDCCTRSAIPDEILERVVRHEGEALDAENWREDAATRLLQADAPLSMLHSLLGMGKKEFALRRKALGMGTSFVPPCLLDDRQSARAYRAWEALGKPSGVGGYLQLHADTGHPLRLLWGLVQDWQRGRRAAGAQAWQANEVSYEDWRRNRGQQPTPQPGTATPQPSSGGA